MIASQSQWIGFAGYRLDTVGRALIAPDGMPVGLTSKAFDVLLHLIEHRDRVVGKDELLAAAWPGRVVEENNLTQAISGLRRALGTGAGDHRFIVTVPGHGYRFVAALQEAALSTSSGSNAAIGHQGTWLKVSSIWSRRWLTASAIAVVLLAIVVIAAFSDRRSGAGNTTSTSPVTLAVLPFRPISGGQRDQMLELGMAETLIARLSQSTNMRVLSLASVQSFSDKDADPLRAGMSLGANLVVDGSTQQRGGSIRVNARLVSLPDGRSVWAGTFDAPPGQVFALQDALARDMSAALSLRYANRKPYRSPCDGSDALAYRAYLRGSYLMNRPNVERVPMAISALKEAIDRDPGCARAWAGLAFAYRTLVMTGDRDPREFFPLAKDAVANALRLDPDSAEAYASKGFIEFWYDWDWKASEVSLLHSIALNGNLSEGHFALAHLLYNIGRDDEAARFARKATVLDPLSPLVNTIAASLLGGERTYQRLQQVLELEPDFWIALFLRGVIDLRRGDVSKAMEDLHRADAACGGCSHVQAVLASAYIAQGDRAAARQVLSRMQQRARTGYIPATRLALVYEALGEHARALDMLERAYDEHDINMAFLLVDGRWQGLQREPRFQALLQRMNLHPPEEIGPGERDGSTIGP